MNNIQFKTAVRKTKARDVEELKDIVIKLLRELVIENKVSTSLTGVDT